MEIYEELGLIQVEPDSPPKDTEASVIVLIIMEEI